LKELRPYQEAVITTSVKEYYSNIIKQLIVIFTGGGKTLTAINLIDRFDFKKPVLWLCYETELISQSGMAFIREKHPHLYDEIKEQGFLDYVGASLDPVVGCIKADVFKIDAPIVLGSVMTVYNRLDNLDPDYFGIIICDEAHRFCSITSYTTLNFFKPKLLIGLTATARREDDMQLGDIFDKIIFEYNLREGIRDGYACEMDGVRIKTTVNLDKVHTVAGEFNQGELSNEVNTLARNQLVVDSYKKYAEGRQAICYCVDIEHAIDLSEQFKMNGYNCQAVSSDKKRTPNREENVDAFKEGTLQIVTNVGVLVTGFDVPDTGCIIMACPTKSLTKFLQSVGRGSRLKTPEFVSKFGQNCIILDIVDVTSRHNLINTWELDRKLPPDERTFITREKAALLAEARAKAKITVQRTEDEKVQLLKLPTLRISTSIKMREEATEKQLAVIERWGYDIKNQHYTKKMVADIFAAQPCRQSDIEILKKQGYDVTSGGVITIGMFQEAMKEINNRSNRGKLSTK
jgi:ATP-dependent helicase IRC3